MSKNTLDETVQEFKQFINSHPHIIKEIRKSGRSWQEYYEKWVILGEDDPYWDQFKQTDKSSEDETFFSTDQYRDLLHQFMSMADKIDLNKVQSQVGELNTTINTVQQLLTQFLEKRQQSSFTNERPFDWFRD